MHNMCTRSSSDASGFSVLALCLPPTSDFKSYANAAAHVDQADGLWRLCLPAVSRTCMHFLMLSKPAQYRVFTLSLTYPLPSLFILSGHRILVSVRPPFQA